MHNAGGSLCSALLMLELKQQLEASFQLVVTSHHHSCSPLLAGCSTASYRVDKLIDQSLGHIRLADDALLVVLSDRATQLVVVHSWTVLSEAP